jgi:hypothetical protein
MGRVHFVSFVVVVFGVLLGVFVFHLSSTAFTPVPAVLGVAYAIIYWRVNSRMRCPKCGTQVTENAPLDFCAKCGADFSRPYVENPIQ